MTDPAERLRVRLGAIFAARERRVREARERADAEARRLEARLLAFRERVHDDVRPAFETAADVVEAHGFEGRVKLDLQPEEGPPSVRFEMHPEDDAERDPALGRATLSYEFDAEREGVRVATTIDGGDHAAFARSHHAEAELPIDRLRAATVEHHLADLVARALDEDPPEAP